MGVRDRRDASSRRTCGNQTTVPTQDRIRFGNAGDLRQMFAAETLCDLSKCRAFGVRKPQPPGGVGAKDTVLRNQVFTLEEQALVYQASDVCQEPGPICCLA